jgi:hypothetical protein
VAIVGFGPFGRAAFLTAQLYSPAEIIPACRNGHAPDCGRFAASAINCVVIPSLIRGRASAWGRAIYGRGEVRCRATISLGLNSGREPNADELFDQDQSDRRTHGEKILT